MKDLCHFARLHVKGLIYEWDQHVHLSMNRQALSHCSQSPSSLFAITKQCGPGFYLQLWLLSSKYLALHSAPEQTSSWGMRLFQGRSEVVVLQLLSPSPCAGFAPLVQCFALVENGIICFNANLWYFISIVNILSSMAPMRFSPSSPRPHRNWFSILPKGEENSFPIGMFAENLTVIFLPTKEVSGAI